MTANSKQNEVQNICNLIQIYETLAKVYKEIEHKNNYEAAGYLKCLYLIRREMKRFSHINLHEENFRLAKENKKLKLQCELLTKHRNQRN